MSCFFDTFQLLIIEVACGTFIGFTHYSLVAFLVTPTVLLFGGFSSLFLPLLISFSVFESFLAPILKPLLVLFFVFFFGSFRLLVPFGLVLHLRPHHSSFFPYLSESGRRIFLFCLF